MSDVKRLAVKTLAGVLGTAIGAAALFTSIPADESGRKVAVTIAPNGTATIRHVSGPLFLRAYLDAVKVPTACDGITRGVRMGQVYTEAQCTAKLEEELYGRPNQAAAAVSLAYNIGAAGFCRSTAARRFKAGQWAAGCDAFLMWNKAGGRVLAGLVSRRKRERALCLTGL